MAFEDVQPQTVDTFSAVLKQTYDSVIWDLIYNRTPATRLVDHEMQETGGQGFYMDFRSGRNQSWGTIAERGEIPQAQHQRYVQHRLQTKMSVGRLGLTNMVYTRGRSNGYAFGQPLDLEIKGLAEDARFSINRMICSGNGSGRLAQVNGAPAGAVITLDNPAGISNPGPGTQFLDTGMIVGGFDEVTGAFRGSGQVVSVDRTANTVTLDAAIAGLLDNDFLYTVSKNTAGVPGALKAGSWGYFEEQIGFFGHIEDEDLPGPMGTTRDLQGIDSATNPLWQSPVIGFGGTPTAFDLRILDEARDVVEQTGNGKTDVWLTTYGIRRAAAAKMVADRRYIDVVNFEGGWRVLTHDGVPIIPEKMMIYGRILGIDRGTFLMAHEGGFKWVDADGSVMRLANGGEQLIWTATLLEMWELGNRARNQNIQIQDIINP